MFLLLVSPQECLIHLGLRWDLNSQLEIMFKFPKLALSRTNLPNLATVKWIPILISHPTVSVISQLLLKGKTPKNMDFESLKDSDF